MQEPLEFLRLSVSGHTRLSSGPSSTRRVFLSLFHYFTAILSLASSISFASYHDFVCQRVSQFICNRCRGLDARLSRQERLRDPTLVLAGLQGCVFTTWAPRQRAWDL